MSGVVEQEKRDLRDAFRHKPRLNCVLNDIVYSDDGEEKQEMWECRFKADKRQNVEGTVLLSTAPVPSHEYYDEEMNLIHPMEQKGLAVHFPDDNEPNLKIDEVDIGGDGVYGEVVHFGDAILFIDVPKSKRKMKNKEM